MAVVPTVRMTLASVLMAIDTMTKHHSIDILQSESFSYLSFRGEVLIFECND